MASSQATRNRRKGAEWENDLKNGLRSVGEDIEHLHLNGREDEGDLVIRNGDGTYTVIEAKNAKFEPGVFHNELVSEMRHFADHRGIDAEKVDGIVIVKRRGKNWRKAWVLSTVEDYFDLEATS